MNNNTISTKRYNVIIKGSSRTNFQQKISESIGEANIYQKFVLTMDYFWNISCLIKNQAILTKSSFNITAGSKKLQ